MTKILLTESFLKELRQQRIATKQDILTTIRKHNAGLPILIELYSPDSGLAVLKGYVGRNRAQRLAVLLNRTKRTYVPFFIAKKSTRHGWNVSKYSIDYLSARSNQSLEDIQNGRYEEHVM